MKIQKDKKYVCVKNFISGSNGVSWSFAAGHVYEALCDNTLIGNPNYFHPAYPIEIREFRDCEKDNFILYDRDRVPSLEANGVYICVKDYGVFSKGEKGILCNGNLMCKKGSSIKVNGKQALEHFYQIGSLDVEKHDKPYSGFKYICKGMTCSHSVMLNERFTCAKDGELRRANGDLVPDSALENFYRYYSIDMEDYKMRVSFVMKPLNSVKTASYLCIKDFYCDSFTPIFERGKTYVCSESGLLDGQKVPDPSRFGIYFMHSSPLSCEFSQQIDANFRITGDFCISNAIAELFPGDDCLKLKAGDRIIYKVNNNLPEHNGYPYYGHVEIQEVSDSGEYIKIFDKWRSLSDIEILDTVNNGKEGN